MSVHSSDLGFVRYDAPDEDCSDFTMESQSSRRFTVLIEEDLTYKIRAAAMEVHRQLGPGLLESAYEECLCWELGQAKIPYQKQLKLPVRYKGQQLDCDYRIDVLVDQRVLLEIKSIAKILPIHEAQILTYLRLSETKVGLLINFNVPILKDGIKRFVL